MKNDCDGHRKRLRGKLLERGASSLADYELIELILSYSIPRRDVKPLAKELLKKFNSISSLFSAESKDICSVNGIGERSAGLIKLIYACHVKYFEEKMLDMDPISNPETVVNFSIASLLGKTDENLMAIFVNSKNRVQDYEIISEGTVDMAVVYPRKIIKKTLEKNANGIILVHNHPSGDPDPSGEDMKLTRAAKEAAAPMDIRVLDHIIIGKGNYFSFLSKGIL